MSNVILVGCFHFIVALNSRYLARSLSKLSGAGNMMPALQSSTSRWRGFFRKCLKVKFMAYFSLSSPDTTLKLKYSSQTMVGSPS